MVGPLGPVTQSASVMATAGSNGELSDHCLHELQLSQRNIIKIVKRAIEAWKLGRNYTK